MRRVALQLGMLALTAALAACGAEDRAVAPNRASALAAAAGGEVAYSILDVGTFGADQAQAFEINDPGTVVGRYGGGAAQRSFAWDAHDGMRDLGDFGGQLFEVLRENNRGDLTGWVPTSTPNVTRAVLLTAKGGFENLDDAAHSSQAWGINEAGAVVGSRSALAPGSTQTAFVWSRRDGLAEIPSLGPGLRSGATAIDNRGRVIGWTDRTVRCCDRRAFLWDPKRGMTLLPSLGGSAFALAMNALGDVVGHSELEPFVSPGPPGNAGLAGRLATHAFFWSEDTGIIDLGTLGGRNSIAWAVGVHHDVYGWAENALGERRSFRWTLAGGMIEMPGLGGTWSQAGGVNARGVVAAQAADAAGVRHAVIYFP